MRNVQMHVLLFLLLLLLPLCALADGGQVSGFAFVDGKDDLTFDEKDSTLRGVQVSLFRVQSEEETLVEKVTTSNDGAFLFANLPAGDYKLYVTLPESEMAEVRAFDALPDNLTYPAITPELFAYLWAHEE